MMPRTSIIAALAASLAIALPIPVQAAPVDDEAEYVREVVGRAAAHVEAERYDDALAELDRAEQERSLPVFVYVRATIEERRGDCERAVALYQRFLGLDPAEEDAADARRGMERCGQAPAPPESPPSPSSEPAVAGPAPSPAPAVSDGSARRRWYADPLGDALGAVGVVGVGVGVGLVLGGRAEAREADDAASLQSFDDHSRRAVALDRAGLVTLGIGSALLLGGVIRWAVVGTQPRRRAAAWLPRPRAAGLLVRF